jgi:phospholipid transport system substrate-binding protein
MRTWTGVALAVIALAATPPLAADTPRVVIEQVTNAALKVLDDRTFDSETKRLRIQDIVYAHVDFDAMTRLVLARNLPRFSDAQKADFIAEFKEHLSLTYGKSIENYKNERVQIVGDHEEARGDWTVKTKIVRGGGGSDDVLVDYRLRQDGGTWKIIDIVIERVSLVANFRSQFQDIVSQGGPEKLLVLLHDKNAKREAFETKGS